MRNKVARFAFVLLALATARGIGEEAVIGRVWVNPALAVGCSAALVYRDDGVGSLAVRHGDSVERMLFTYRVTDRRIEDDGSQVIRLIRHRAFGPPVSEIASCTETVREARWMLPRIGRSEGSEPTAFDYMEPEELRIRRLPEYRSCVVVRISNDGSQYREERCDHTRSPEHRFAGQPTRLLMFAPGARPAP